MLLEFVVNTSTSFSKTSRLVVSVPNIYSEYYCFFLGVTLSLMQSIELAASETAIWCYITIQQTYPKKERPRLKIRLKQLRNSLNQINLCKTRPRDKIGWKRNEEPKKAPKSKMRLKQGRNVEKSKFWLMGLIRNVSGRKGTFKKLKLILLIPSRGSP